MDIDRNGLQVLEREECLRLLRDHHLGRVSVTDGALPAVLPVNYWFDGKRILVVTGRGSKLEAAAREAVVAFEIDDFDPVEHRGWSVMVTGVAREVTDQLDLDELVRAPLVRWIPRHDPAVIAIDVQLVSGRRMGLPVRVAR